MALRIPGGRRFFLNLLRAAQEQESLGIFPVLWKDEAKGQSNVLPMVRAG
jgi:hypothetical protein